MHKFRISGCKYSDEREPLFCLYPPRCDTVAATFCTLRLQVMHIWLNTAQGHSVIREAIFLLHRIPSILENGLQRILIKSLE